MRKVLIIGIGAGHPDYVTIQAVNAMNEVDVFFLPNKGAGKQQLAEIRREICARYAKAKEHRIVEFETPERNQADARYKENVELWREDVKTVYERLIVDEMREGDCAAFLVWGDPSLYDGTISVLNQIRDRCGFDLEYDVIPGITSIQALAARHKVTLNRIGQSIQITTGRRLAEGFPNNADSIVVMLDAQTAFRTVEQPDVDIFWGAYIGTEDEILVAGKLSEVMGDIVRIREAARSSKGWIMDTYLLKKTGED